LHITPAAKCTNAIPNFGVFYDVTLICIFFSTFLIPVWRWYKEWLAMQQVYERCILAVSGVSHPSELTKTLMRSVKSYPRSNPPDLEYAKTSCVSPYVNAGQVRQVDEWGGVELSKIA
jgi:hypothetical protein